MRACGGCGFRNRDDQAACVKCGQVFEDEPAGRQVTPLQKIIGVLAFLAAVAIVVAKLLLPSKMELKLERARARQEQAEARRVSSRPLIDTGAEAPDPQARAAPPPAPKPLPPREEPEELTPRQRGEKLFHDAERKFAAGDYPGAAEDYQQAERLGTSTPEGQERRKTCADIAYIVMYREYMKSAILEPARLVGAKSNLAMVNPILLPDETWREEHRKTLESVNQAYKRLVGDERGGNYEAQQQVTPPPRPPRLVPDEVWKTLRFLLKPVAPDGGTIRGATFTEVHPDGLFWKAGIRVGDVLLEINDQPLTHMNQIMSLRDTVDRSRALWGVVLRDDRRVPFRVDFPGVK